MFTTIEKLSDTRGLVKATHAPCRYTLDLYHTKAKLVDTTISFVKEKYTMNKMSRRQMSFTYMRNIIRLIDTVAYSNFPPCTIRWESYYKVSNGAQEIIDIIKYMTGTYVQPINSTFLLNKDCSSQYF